jgi:hypothetical protein
MADNPMQGALPMHISPRCGAKTRSGEPCRSPAMPNGRCRMHGGVSPGAPTGARNGNYKHGRFTQAAIRERRTIAMLARLLRAGADRL